jgi:hypothetical protein
MVDGEGAAYRDFVLRIAQEFVNRFNLQCFPFAQLPTSIFYLQM